MNPAPQTTPGIWPAGIAPSRWAAGVRTDPQGCRVALLGLPDDTGVALNHGRPGARNGPTALRRALASYGVADPARGRDLGRDDHDDDDSASPPFPMLWDAGDVVPIVPDSDDPSLRIAAMLATHERVRQAAAALAAQGMIVLAVGGGHDLTLPLVLGVMAAPIANLRVGGGRVGGVYLDAHLDVRDTPGSGMPFRELIRAGLGPVLCAGMNPLVNSREHAAWFAQHGGTIRPGWSEPDLGPVSSAAHLFCSFDLDVLDTSHAPGVSALNPAGWSVREGAAWMDVLASDPRTACIDLMELNPEHDQQGRTARVAAHLALVALRAIARREGASRPRGQGGMR